MYTIREIAEKCNADSRYNGKVLLNEPLARHTTMGVGGNAAAFFEPSDEDALVFALGELRANDVPYFVLGGGSNVIISDQGIDGAVVSTRKLSGIKFLTERTECTESGENLSTDYTDYADDADDADYRISVGDFPSKEGKSAEICGICGYITVAAGASWGAVLAFCREKNLGGLEAFAGLSGTVGGAVYMNATCFGLSACDRLVSVRYLDTATGEICTYTLNNERRKCDWGYKKSPFQYCHADSSFLRKLTGALRGTPRRGGSEQQSASEGETSPFERKIILSAQFALTQRFDNAKAEHCLAQRKEKGHFRLPSAGSVFKNDVANGVIAGKVIDECGLKGYAIGGAKVADWHGNFIVNTGNATATDIWRLVRHVQDVVRAQKGVDLVCEIIFAGDFSH